MKTIAWRLDSSSIPIVMTLCLFVALGDLLNARASSILLQNPRVPIPRKIWHDPHDGEMPMLLPPEPHLPIYPAPMIPPNNYNVVGYPLTPPQIKFRIGIISDMDRDSIDKSETGKWRSFMKEGNLFVQQNKMDPSKTNVSIQWDEDAIHVIKSGYSYTNRGMELSTLNVFNGKLYACDDRTGIVYQLDRDSKSKQITPIPWAILADGNFTGNRGFKCEWGTVKNGNLFIGGIGADKRTENGTIIDTNNKFVKRITAHGEVTHIDWSRYFEKMANALNIHFPGYVIHEAAGWSSILRKWMFMPRKVSQERFESKADEQRGSNVVLLADENFDNVQVGHIGQLIPTHGFAGFKWIPSTNDRLVVAIKTLESDGLFQTYIMAFDLDGNVLLPETKITDHKFEGIEFL